MGKFPGSLHCLSFPEQDVGLLPVFSCCQAGLFLDHVLSHVGEGSSKRFGDIPPGVSSPRTSTKEMPAATHRTSACAEAMQQFWISGKKRASD